MVRYVCIPMLQLYYVDGNDINVISKQFTEDMERIADWLRNNMLLINTDKTNVLNHFMMPIS